MNKVLYLHGFSENFVSNRAYNGVEKTTYDMVTIMHGTRLALPGGHELGRLYSHSERGLRSMTMDSRS